MKTSPIRIGYSLSLTGPVSENAKAARLTHQIWERDINSRGGLLGRSVMLTCIDDRGDAAHAATIYRDLLDNDRVDLVLGGYGTNTLAASMPVVMEHKKFLIGLMGLGVNNELGYPNYFAMIPTGMRPNTALTEGFFELAAAQSPAPKTVVLLSAEAEFSINPVIGARANAAKYGLEVIKEFRYPLSTVDFTPVIEELGRVNADILFICSYLSDSVGLIKAISSGSYRPKMLGGAMIGPQSASVKTDLGPLLNGIVNYEYWVPVPKMEFTGVRELLAEYQRQAMVEKTDLLGYYVVPLAYAQLQVLEQAVRNTGSLNDEKLSEYCRGNAFETVMGTIRFAKGGEWEQARVVQVQFQNIRNKSIETFKDNATQVIVAPQSYASGTFMYPYSPDN
ncbi:ABC transporter substrate-binding protein [Flavobacterium alkalisoli]|uniref:ABC transporter substrate-binding protein n=1 Tax=Flavobacterium alkalisoli TaxID=2602769 RepID=A0A5B9FWU6_9FLAO|nr:amino acid ABC transporter substrate-binding protein [Flavobacterium alkalisoli]QEE50258.1 ABC transporter substrate-binding protein [Flavobacterium alkalisoli]